MNIMLYIPYNIAPYSPKTYQHLDSTQFQSSESENLWKI